MSADLWTWCEWTPDIAARELLTGPGGIDNATHWELATKIREAIIHGSLPAERRAKKVWFIDHHEELTDHYSAPAEVIRWAIHAGVDVPQPYLDWYRTNAPQDAPALVEESQAKPRAFTQEPAEHYPLPDPLNESWREDSAMELIERRMCAISWVIESKEFERMALENGDKGRIKGLCEHSAPKLFKGSTVFDDAWKLGSKREWWRMANYDKFTKNRAP